MDLSSQVKAVDKLIAANVATKSTDIENFKKLSMKISKNSSKGSQPLEYFETDPTGQYGRYNEVLGRGGFKTVYRAFDEVNGMEVAWNQVNITHLLQSSGELQQLYSEVNILKTLGHKNIMRMYSSWVDNENKHVNFVTELFSSGTLREYCQKQKHVSIHAIKKWARQILKGLHYLHTHDPPIVHRDLKCDNIFINGGQGEVKIGDFGLATILPQGHTLHSIVGTPEFVAPEVFNKGYNELVDIYSFGMYILELVTMEYPYTECTTFLEIYKAITSGKMPVAFSRLQDPEVKAFVRRCLSTADLRPSAEELLLDPFLLFQDDPKVVIPLNSTITPTPVWKAKACKDFQRGLSFDASQSHIKVPSSASPTLGERIDDAPLSLRLRVADFDGHIQQIQFPFVLKVDTSMGVASELITEFDLVHEDKMSIAKIIDAKIRELVPDWEPEGSQNLCKDQVIALDKADDRGDLC